MEKYEIELKIKLQVKEKQLLEEYLHTNKNSINFLGGFEQTDYYFDTVTPSFAEKDTALRVRVERDIDNDKKDCCIELTYKGAKIHSDSKTRLEYNLNLIPSTDLDTVENFFKELGFVKAIELFKKRRNYQIEDGVVLSLDTNELGDFVEIEKISEDQNSLVSTEDYLWKMLQEMIGPIPKERKIVKSYLELILESRMEH